MEPADFSKIVANYGKSSGSAFGEGGGGGGGGGCDIKQN